VRPAKILLFSLAALLALALPGSAIADSGGGVAAPGGGATAQGGGTVVGTPVPAARKQARRKPVRRKRARRRPAKPVAPVVPVTPVTPVIPEGEHAFPVAGPYTMDGEGARFGAPRSGHTHRGHDIAAALGTPVVAPYAGVIDWVRYQRAGAGHYVVLDADDGHDYVFMHLRSRSIPVVAGQRVATGEQLGQVGNTGRSFGAHLHFEVWTGGWYEKGGAAIDPLPLLEAWATR
jgi:murein DD-endopeptidase MepM/ murein hydrolase activator NlpD